MQYFDGQKTRTFAEFWEQREAGGVKVEQKSKTKKKKGEEKEARRIAAEMQRIEGTILDRYLNPADLSVGFYEGDVEEFSN